LTQFGRLLQQLPQRNWGTLLSCRAYRAPSMCLPPTTRTTPTTHCCTCSDITETVLRILAFATPPSHGVRMADIKIDFPANIAVLEGVSSPSHAIKADFLPKKAQEKTTAFVSLNTKDNTYDGSGNSLSLSLSVCVCVCVWLCVCCVVCVLCMCCVSLFFSPHTITCVVCSLLHYLSCCVLL